MKRKGNVFPLYGVVFSSFSGYKSLLLQETGQTLPDTLIHFAAYSPFMKPNSPFHLPRRFVVWLCRFRHRCGYGIHSPYAFSLVRDVVYEHAAYYAYAGLGEDLSRKVHGLREKDYRLLFRLSNASGAKAGWVIGREAANVGEYVRAARPSCLWTTAQTDVYDSSAFPGNNPSPGFVYMEVLSGWETLFLHCLSVVPDGGLIVIQGLHSQKSALRAWHRLVKDERIRVVFDLWDFVIVSTEKRLDKTEYVVNYF